MEEELLKLEREFGEAIVKNDADAIASFVSDDWIIIDSDGNIIDKSRFFDVIKSGELTHESMGSDDFRVRVYGDCALVSALTQSKGKFMGQEFTSLERGNGRFCQARRALAVRSDASDAVCEPLNRNVVGQILRRP